jgi:hypothetical protein
MKKMDRRSFVIATAAAAASLKTFAQSPAAATPLVNIALHPDQPGHAIPANFVGLSYETQQLSDPTFFSAANTGLIAQFKALAPHGVLRIGGNTSDYGFWKPTPTSIAPPRPTREYKVGDPPPDLSYAVTPEAVRNLRAFLDATGWTCLYGINLGTNTPALAAEEAVFVSKTLGAKLEYFQVGNEADRFGTTIRDPKTWNAHTYFDEWLSFAKAIRAAVPSARFGLPDTAGNPDWYITIVERLVALAPADRPEVAALTHHYYFTGPPSNPKATIENLLKPDPHVLKLASDIHAAAAKLMVSDDLVGHRDRSPIPYRMTEGNSCYRGGKPGFSDVFAASLWSADYFLKLASLGYSGVNLHGGDGQMVANSLGGKLPGDELVHDNPASHPHPYYTPIAHIRANYVDEPVSFGMRFAQEFAGSTLIPVDFDPRAVNATAYAAKRPNGEIILAIINKDATQALTPTIIGYRETTYRSLKAASLTSTEVSFNETQIRYSGHVPPATAVLINLTA